MIGQGQPADAQADAALAGIAEREPGHLPAVGHGEGGAVAGRAVPTGGVGALRLAVEPEPAAAEHDVVQHLALVGAAEGDARRLVGGENVVPRDQRLGDLHVHAAATGEDAVLHDVVERVLVPPRALEAGHLRQKVAVLPNLMVGKGDVFRRVVVAVEEEGVAHVEGAMIDVQFGPLEAVGGVSREAGDLAAHAHVGPAPAEGAIAHEAAAVDIEVVAGTEADGNVVEHVADHAQAVAPAILLLMAVGVAADGVEAADRVRGGGPRAGAPGGKGRFAPRRQANVKRTAPRGRKSRRLAPVRCARRRAAT